MMWKQITGVMESLVYRVASSSVGNSLLYPAQRVVRSLYWCTRAFEYDPRLRVVMTMGIQKGAGITDAGVEAFLRTRGTAKDSELS